MIKKMMMSAPVLAAGLLMLGGCGKTQDAASTAADVASTTEVSTAADAASDATTVTTDTVTTSTDSH